MTSEQLREIFDSVDSEWVGDNAMQGLIIIGKYFSADETIICAAEHDEIYSFDVDKILAAGLTDDDAMKLAKLNWMIDDENGCLACFV
jgi:hypothetical protein